MAFPRNPEVSSESLEGWRREVGHEAEGKVFEVLVKRVGWEPVEMGERALEEIAVGFRGEKIGIARAPARWDWERGIDLIVFAERTPVPIDMTISRDPQVHAQKLQREKHGGPVFLPLPKRTIDWASRGSERDIQEIGSLVREGVRGYLERRKI